MPTNSDIDKILLRLRFRRPSSSSSASSYSTSSNTSSLITTSSLEDDLLSIVKRECGRKRQLPLESADSLEPLDLTSTRSKKRQLHSLCGAKNCGHQSGTVYTDVLFKPELLKTVRGGEDNSSSPSSNPLLEFCLDGGISKAPKSAAPLKQPLPPPLSSSCSALPLQSLLWSTAAAEEKERSKDDLTAAAAAAAAEAKQKALSVKTSEVGPLLLLEQNPLLRCCSTSPFAKEESEELKRILGAQDGHSKKIAIGCDKPQIHARGPKGQTAMHFLINGCTRETFHFVLDSIYLLLSFGFDLRLTDPSSGNTALTAIHSMLAKELFQEAHLLALLFLQTGSADINHANAAGRTILSHSVAHGDAAILTSRLLINHGAKVLPANPVVDISKGSSIVAQLALERERSAFTWFLRSVMDNSGLAGCDETISLLSHAMGDDPMRMESHVMRVMMHLGHSILAMGPVFNEIRAKMAPFWTRPQGLRYLCLRQIRKSIGPKKLSEDRLMETLNIPNTMMNYLQLA